MSPPLTLQAAQERYLEVVDELRDAVHPEHIEELGREIMGLKRLIEWLREREAA